MAETGISFITQERTAVTARDRLFALLPSLLVTLIGAVLALATALGDLEQERVQMRSESLRNVRSELQVRFDTLAGAMRQTAFQVRSQQSAEAALMSGNQAVLALALGPLAETLKAGGELVTLSVYDRNLKPLYRCCSPKATTGFDRAMLKQTDILGAMIFAIRFDTAQAGVVHGLVPWISGGKTIGYLEISQSADHMFQKFGSEAGFQFALLPSDLANGPGLNGLPADITKLLDREAITPLRSALQTMREGHPDASVTLKFADKHFDIGPVRLPAQAQLGESIFVVFHDATEREARLQLFMLRRLAMWAVGAALFMGACYFIWIRLTRAFGQQEQVHLLQRQEQVGAILNAVVDGVVIIGTDGTILTFNPAAETIFGYSASEAVGQNVRMLMASGLGAQHQGFIERYMQSGRPHIIGVKREVTGRRKDGTEFQLDLAVSQSSVGGETVFIGILRDVTERKLANEILLETLRQQKEAQQALRRRSDELIRAARELTRARDKAEASNEAKSRFLAAMSHELRTPLNGILGMTGLIAASALNHDQKNWVHLIRESGEALLTLLNDILDLSKIEAGRFQIRPAELRPFDLARQLLVSWEHLAREKGIALSLDCPPAGPTLSGDSMRVRQILTNFISNAVKFTDQGSVAIRVILKDHGQNYVLRYEVADTGCGIAEEKLPLLFEKFSEVDIEASRRHNGAGLGLSISQEIASLMGGRVGVESVLGVGSVFWFEMECSAYREEQIETASPLDMTAVSPTPQDQCLHILVAEDHPVNQKLFLALLGHMGHQVTIVNNGQEVLRALEEQPFDIVLMDANMPIMGGAEATKRIRQMSGGVAHIPIVAVTAEAMVGDRERFLALGMDDYITKPIDQAALAELIGRFADKRAFANRAAGAA